jgi:hypothetical protein
MAPTITEGASQNLPGTSLCQRGSYESRMVVSKKTALPRESAEDVCRLSKETIEDVCRLSSVVCRLSKETAEEVEVFCELFLKIIINKNLI